MMNQTREKNNKRILFLIPLILCIALPVLYWIPMRYVPKCNLTYSVIDGMPLNCSPVFGLSLAFFISSLTLSLSNIIVKKNKVLRILTYVVYLITFILFVVLMLLGLLSIDFKKNLRSTFSKENTLDPWLFILGVLFFF